MAIALVTGASRGIGPYIARGLASAGYTVALTARSAPELAAVESELRSGGATAVAVPADLSDGAQVDRLVAVVEERLGPVDLLVNNAGGDPQREFDIMSWQEADAIMRLNLVAPVQLTHRLLPGMLARGRGHIVNVSSIGGHVGFPYTEAYSAAKDGLIAFTRVLRNDYRGRGVSASAVILGAIRGAGQGQRTSDEMGTKMPRAWTAPPEDVARAVVEAVRADRAEIVVMPGPGRLLKAMLDLFPSLGGAMNRFSGANATMARVIEFRKAQVRG